MQSETTAGNRAPLPIYFLGAVLIALVAFCDWWTGPDLSLALCYLIPTTVVAWRAGKLAGVITGAASTVVWLGVELEWHRTYTNPFTPYSNFILQLSVTLFSALVTAAVADRKRKLQSEIQVRKETEAKLNALNETLEIRVAERSAAAEKRAEELSYSEAAFRRQTSVLKSILTSMGDGVVVTNEDGDVRLFNPAAMRMLKLLVNENDASQWSDNLNLSLPDILSHFGIAPRVLFQTLRADLGRSLEFCTHLPSAEHDVWLSMSAQPLIDANLESHGFVFVFCDITTRKQVDRLMADVSEREQERIGQDLHDGLGQHLVSTAFAVNMLTEKLAEKNMAEAEESREIAELVNSAITRSRDLARGLYPVKLEEEGLLAALQELADSTGRKAGIDCRMQSQPGIHIHDARISSNLYRLTQEAVNNALKHGQPSKILISVWQNGDALTLTVTNNGKRFFAPGPRNRGMGLHIMKYRARIIGADFAIGPDLEGGTLVQCCVPNLQQKPIEHAPV